MIERASGNGVTSSVTPSARPGPSIAKCSNGLNGWLTARKSIDDIEFLSAQHAGDVDAALTYADVNADLWAALMDKTKGEARERVIGTNRGDGIEAYRKVFHWFTVTSLQGTVECRNRITDPILVKREEEVAGALDKWQHEYRELMCR